MKNLKTYLLFAIIVLNIAAYAQPANDICIGAIDLGTLPTPNVCDGSGTEGQGTTVSFNGLTNVNSTADNPYTYIADCQGTGTDMANPAQDVWYSVTATGNSITIDISNLSGFSNHSIGFWEGNCAGLTARGCANGMGTSSTVFEPTTPGQTYYIQFSGDGSSSEGTFDLDISNSNDCSQCVLSSSITPSPLPVNGTYTAGTEVEFCYTVSEFEKINTNWLHGVTIENLGPGWDATFGTGGISVTSTPGSCQGNYGDWQYFSGGAGCKGLSEPGWYYILPTSANPCQNFGDPGVAEPGGMGNCALTFCFTLRTDPLADCDASNPESLGFSINTTADGETGSWTSAACQNDPDYGFNAIQACCTDPIAVIDNQILCFGDSTGVATVTAGSISDPFNYQWYTSTGTLGFETLGSTPTTNTESSLFEDIYTIIVTDNNGCQAATNLTMTTAPGATITSDVDDILCGNEDKTINTFVASPAGSTFEWIASTDVGFGTTGTTQIGTFTAINNTGSIITSDVTVVPISSLGCGGVPEVFSLSVNPSPLVTTNYTDDCSAGGDITSSFTPVPVTSDIEFTNGLVVISKKGGNPKAQGSAVSTISISNITPSTLQNGQITSACFSLRHECYLDIDALSLTVDGTTYTNSNNTDLANILTAIRAETGGVLHQVCLPTTFLDLLDGGTANSDWVLTINDGATDNCNSGGGAQAIGDLIEFEVIIENTPEYDFLWSGGTLAGTTSGTSTVATLPTVTASVDGTYILQVSDQAGCTGIDTAIFNCALALQDIDFNVNLIERGNNLDWLIYDITNVKSFNIERNNNQNIWNEIETIKSNKNNSYSYLDYSFNSGINYYRLKINNNDGTVDYSQTISITNKSNSKNVIGIFNTLGQKVNKDEKGLKYIFYDDGSKEKTFEY